MKKSILISLILVFSISLTAPVAAEQFDYKEKTCECSCFRGKPLGECNTYWVIETGYMTRVNDDNQSGTKENLFLCEFGRMRNLSKKSALGGTFSIMAHEGVTTFGIGPRYRYWISQRMGLDISPHLIFANTGTYKTDGYGYQINASIAIGELFSINGHYRNVSYKPGGDVLGPAEDYGPFGGYQRPAEKGFYFGMSGRSYAAPVVPAVILFFHLMFKDYGVEHSTLFF